ncbi:type VII secretion target [Mycolicibacterium pyrenivorans]|uniref:type VII secretion target n=1 Tax=Mycolicibacterium pyrenivorans TaxID=187102 RepID=UPI0021F30973|nr:type VII secretion target [Mycolicibacterium pyrenivorans]MCV7152926.1 hypothetical protein [Mycolicibacterium pyrenivorans]
MLVDPDILRVFATHVDTASSAIRGADVGGKVVDAADGLPGSTTQWAAHSVGEHISKIANDLADDVHKMGLAVRGAGDSYEVTDTELAGSFDGLFG